MPRPFVEFASTPFDSLPSSMKTRAFGVEYAKLDDGTGGTMFVTLHGWPLLEHLCPVQWWDRQQYVERGERMTEGTGAVYRVTAGGLAEGRTVDLVVKFSRFAQDVPLQVATEFLRDIPVSSVDNASFLSPFEEFGLLMDLRSGRFGDSRLRVRTKRPLGIYCTPSTHPVWQLGRKNSRFYRDAARLAQDQEGAGDTLTLREDHEYIVLFGWLKGENSAEYHRRGLLSREDLRALTARVTAELKAKGFRVLDNKPAHFILREREPGKLLRRHGELVYGLVDFELLERTEEYEAALEAQQVAGATG